MLYLPKHFREEDPARLRALMRSHSFATMIAIAREGGGVEIAHVPVVVDDDGSLRMHVAMANSIWRTALAAGKVTFVFQGPHAYVSADWYSEPRATVPTWNYAVVHAHGTPSRLDGDELVQLLDDLTTQHDTTWRRADADASMVDQLLLAIVGLRVRVTKLEAKFKLSQNRSAEDRARVIDALRARNEDDLAALMSHYDRADH